MATVTDEETYTDPEAITTTDSGIPVWVWIIGIVVLVVLVGVVVGLVLSNKKHHDEDLGEVATHHHESTVHHDGGMHGGEHEMEMTGHDL